MTGGEAGGEPLPGDSTAVAEARRRLERRRRQVQETRRLLAQEVALLDKAQDEASGRLAALAARLDREVREGSGG